MDDIGLQRAIYASLQAQFEYARVTAQSNSAALASHYHRGGPAPSSAAAAFRYPSHSPQQQQQRVVARQPSTGAPRRDIAPTVPRISNSGAANANHNKRSTLAREGILPTGGGRGGARIAPTPARSDPPPPGRQTAGKDDEEPPVWIDIDESGKGLYEDSRQVPVTPKPSDSVAGWTELCSRGRVQRQHRDGTHILLITDEIYNTSVNDFPESIALHGVGMPAFLTVGAVSSTQAIGQLSAQVQNLSGRGRYVCACLGCELPPSCRPFSANEKSERHASTSCNAPDLSNNIVRCFGASVHFDPNGCVFVSVDEWHIKHQMITRERVLMAPTPVRLLKDKVVLSVAFFAEWDGDTEKMGGANIRLCSTVVVNQETIVSRLAFGAVSGSETEPNGAQRAVVGELWAARTRPMMFAAGGRVSLKALSVNETARSEESTASSPLGNNGMMQGSPQQRGSAAATKPPTTRAGAPQPAGQRSAAGVNNCRPLQPASHQSGAANIALPPNVDRDLAARILDEVLETRLNVTFDDIAGMSDAKRLLNEAIVLPLLVPELFTGVLQPWKGVLLYGPPGTGKTMLARAVAASAKTTFFNMSASTLIQKHFGESEKMIRTLFQVARAHSPATIFFDEVDALMGSRGGSQEHDAMRRVKAELLQQMDGLHSDVVASYSGEASACAPRVMVLATTNRPWDLDDAMRRRLEKRIYVPLPDLSGRLDLLTKQCKTLSLSEGVRLESIARRTDGLSGADLNLLCRNAAMMPMRRFVEGKSPEQIAALRARGEMVVGHVTEEDFDVALKRTNPSVGRECLAEFEQWTREFAST